MNDNIKDKPITPPEKDVFSEPEVVVSAENASEETSDTPVGQKLPEETEKDDNKEKKKRRTHQGRACPERSIGRTSP